MRTRTAVAIGTLVLPLSLATPVRAQCGEGWVPGFGGAGTDGRVDALALLPNGDVVVGGTFDNAGGIHAGNIALVNPATGAWTALGLGTDGAVAALAVLPEGDIIVGGRFATAGGLPASNVARVNPTTGVWSALGSGVSGLNNAVWSLVVLPSNGDVIVAGDFNVAGGLPANRVARYSTSASTWSSMGSGTDGVASTLAVLPDGNVYVGGNFIMAGGVLAWRNAIYDPITGNWSTLGAGFGIFPTALASLPDGDVIVGGTYATTGSADRHRVARRDQATGLWSTLGAGLIGSSNVHALAARTGDDVIVGGQFSVAGGVVLGTGGLGNIARYNTATSVWSAMGAGTNSSVYDILILPGGDMLAAGLFTTAGGMTSNHIARYTFGSHCCPADLDNDGDFANGLTRDGAVTIEDLLSFLVGFEAGNVLVDLDNGTGSASVGGTPDGAVDINDLLFFLVRFEAGC